MSNKTKTAYLLLFYSRKTGKWHIYTIPLKVDYPTFERVRPEVEGDSTATVLVAVILGDLLIYVSRSPLLGEKCLYVSRSL